MISNNYILVKKYEEKQEGFATVEVQDSFLYKGEVVEIPEAPVYMGNDKVTVGDVIIFSKYSPDTHDYEENGQKLKFINTKDILKKI